MPSKYPGIILGALLFLGLATGKLPAQNISLVGSFKPAQASSGYGDVWGNGNIACMGVWTAYSTYGVGIFDISNPAAPNLLSIYNYSTTTQNRFEQGVIRSNVLYVGCWASGTSWSGSGLHILSIVNPSSPVLLSRITRRNAGTVTNGFDDVHTLFLERNFLYEAAHNINTVNVKVFDVSNPALPVYVRDITTTNTTKVHQLTVGMKGTNTILYTSGWGGADNSNLNSYGQTDIWDVSNIGTQPAKWLGRIYSGYNSHSSWPTPDGNTLVVCRERPGGEVSLYDITTPPNPSPNSITNPVPIAVISPATMGIEADIPHNPVIVSNLLFLSWYQNGLQIFDISDRTKPVRIGSYDTYPSAATSSYQGNWGIFPHLGLNKLLVSDINNGFFILDASAVLTNTNNYPVMLLKGPTSQSVEEGSSASLTCTATGSNLRYQWKFNSSPIADATNSVYTINPAQSSNSGSYSVVVSNTLNSITSANAALSVTIPSNVLPAISAQPQDVSVYEGQSTSFSVGVTGTSPFYFQWYINGTAITGATTNTFDISSVHAENVGTYFVTVTNAYGSTTSSNATLTIIDSPYINGVKATPGARSALISWNTSVPSSSEVQYDESTAPGQQAMSAASASASFSQSSYTDTTLTTNHTILLTGLTPATSYNFQVVSSASTNNYVSGVYSFSTGGGGPITLDNTNAAVSFLGNWSTGTSSSDKFGSDYRFATATPSLSNAVYRPTLPIPGNYDVFTWYPQGANRCTNVPFFISFGGNSQTVNINQQVNGGQWLPLGRWQFNAGTNDFVRISDNALPLNSVVLADAVRFAYVESQDFPTDGTVPFWWSNFYFGNTVSPSDDPDGDGYTTAQEYILGTSPVAANSHLSVQVFRSGNNANVLFSPCLGNRNYTLLQNTNLLTGSWQPIATGSISPSPTGEGSVTLSIANGAEGFYRLAVELTTNSTFSGSIATPAVKAFSPYATDPICGPNRAYIK